MRQSSVPFVLMRGGTSKCVLFHERDLPPAGADRDRLLLAVFGSPDPRQIDGIGGATSTTSKAGIIAPSARLDADVEYTFGQVSVAAPLVDYGGNCGNCSSAVGPFSIDEGLVQAADGITPVRIYNTNTRKLIVAEVPVTGGKAEYSGDYQIAGVPGSGAPQRLWFYDPAGSMTGRLLPTGHARDEVEIQGRVLTISIVDAANPVAFVRASDLGLRGTETPAEIDSQPELLRRLQEIRGRAAAMIGLVDEWKRAESVTPGVPKIAMVAASQSYTDLYGHEVHAGATDLCARALSMGKAHAAYQLTGAIATGAAAHIPGTIVHELRHSERKGCMDVHIAHPSGIIDVEVETTIPEDGAQGDAPRIVRAAAYRTARRLAAGVLYVRPDLAWHPGEQGNPTLPVANPEDSLATHVTTHYASS